MAEYNVIGNITVNFNIPENNEDIVSGEPLNIIIGKITKRLGNSNNCYITDNDGQSGTYDIRLNFSHDETEDSFTLTTSNITFSAQEGALYMHDAKAFGNNSLAVNNSIATGINSVAFGNNNYSLASMSSTFGEDNVIDQTSNVSFAEGNYNTIINSSYAHIEGNQNVISESNSAHVEGNDNKALNSQYSHVEGYGNKATAICTHAEGHVTTASGEYSHSEGVSTVSSSYSSHAEGYDSLASGDYSHAEGSNTIASGKSSHSEGCLSQSIGNTSHAEGYETKSIGSSSHSGGENTTTYGSRSFAHGKNLIALAEDEFVIGHYNHANNDQLALFTIGSGVNAETTENLLRIKSNSNVECGTNTGTPKKIYNLLKPAGERMDVGTESAGSTVVIPDKDQGNTITSGTASLLVGQSNTIDIMTHSLVVGVNNESQGSLYDSLLIGSSLNASSGGNHMQLFGTSNTTSDNVYASMICGSNNYVEKANQIAVFGQNNVINETPSDSTGSNNRRLMI